MAEKKNKILTLSQQTEPKLTRAQIAREVGCSAAFVTNTLGSVRAYNRKRIPCEGCANETCKSSGCIAA